jgi:signal transduction histidine kinase
MEMSFLVIAWTMCASMSLMLGLMHLLFWLFDRGVTAYLLATVMGFGAAISAMLELNMLLARSPESYSILLRWENLAIYLILVPLVWFIHQYLLSGRRWLAILITALWSAGILINFLMPGNLTFYEVTELNYQTSFWGESFALPIGVLNPWRILADIASLLILVFTVDAALQLWRRTHRKRAWIFGGAVMTFILFAGIHTPLVDAGLVRTPYLISFSFLAIVFALSYQVVLDAGRGSRYARELRETRRNLDQLSRANLLGEYTTMLAHELNQPLTAILSNAQAARKYLVSKPPKVEVIHEILDDIVRDDKRATEIINWLRSMLQNQETKREFFSLNAAIEEVVAILEPDLKQKDINLSVQYDRDMPAIYVGRIELQQVMLNLLANAIRAVDGLVSTSRVINVRTNLIKGAVKVDVVDFGAGISNELLGSLFDAFVSREKDGIGMGLAICRRIIEAYEGRIWVKNAKAGGAVFSFTLPVNIDNQDGYKAQ